MKINERMRYPHPVLSEYSSDYVTGGFHCEFEQNLTTENELRIAAKLIVEGDVLLKLIEEQKAAIGYFIVCRRTYFNALAEAALGKSEHFVDASKLFGTVLIRPVIWTIMPISGFSSPLFDSEFGLSVDVAKGSIIALGPEFRFSMDRKKYKPFDSIFQLSEVKTVTKGMVEVDPSQDRITISAEPATYRSIVGMRDVQLARGILLNAVYMPAIMDVVARLQAGDASLQSRKWYRVFRAKCDDLGIDPLDRARSALEIAQILLRAPLTKTIAAVEKM